MRLMWCSRRCRQVRPRGLSRRRAGLGPPATSVACLWHVSVVGGARCRGCAAAGVLVFVSRPLPLDVEPLLHPARGVPRRALGDVAEVVADAEVLVALTHPPDAEVELAPV